MRKLTLQLGAIAGLIMISMFYLTHFFMGDEPDFSTAEWLGYTTMILALSTVFLGIKSYRDHELKGSITFGKAFRIGLEITTVASIIYVAGWILYYNTMAPDFMDKYQDYSIEQLRQSGETEQVIEVQIKEMESFSELYKNPLVMIAITFLEIFPVGLLVTLVSAALLKKKESLPTAV